MEKDDNDEKNVRQNHLIEKDDFDDFDVMYAESSEGKR